MQPDYIDTIEQTPELNSKKCKVISFVIRFILQTITTVAGLIAWVMYDYFVAGATLLLTFIVMGIVRSKLRNEVIPLKQREHYYNDKDIAIWYTAKAICDDVLEKELEDI